MQDRSGGGGKLNMFYSFVLVVTISYKKNVFMKKFKFCTKVKHAWKNNKKTFLT